MARAKRIYILIIRVNKLFSFFSSRCFLKEIENMYSVFLSSYRNTRESLGELEKAVETLARGSCSHSNFRYFLIIRVKIWKKDHLLISLPLANQLLFIYNNLARPSNHAPLITKSALVFNPISIQLFSPVYNK